MAQKRPGFLRRFFGALWSGIDTSRRVAMNLVFLLIVGLLLAMVFGGGSKPLKEKTTLILDPRGEIVEQYSGSPTDAALAKLLGDEVPETQLRDILRVLEEAAKDDKIGQVLLKLDSFGGAGASTLREVGRALLAFRESGKKVIAHGEFMAQAGYYLAAHADEIYVHPDGVVLLEGFGRYRTYYRSALDKLGIKMHVFRVGTFKSAVEPYLLDGPSDAAREADSFWLEDLWTVFLEDIAAVRKLEVPALRTMIDEFPQRLTAADGDPVRMALDERLVDGTKTPDELRTLLIASGAKDDEKETFRQIRMQDYLKRLDKKKPEKDGKDGKVGIIVAAGVITGGNQPQGQIGGKSTSALVRKAREDKDIKAIVLRVDSPGGSGFDSELIRREIEITRNAGKPVYVSMGDVAASGGYWISMSSDAIFVEPTTITGSIGIFGLFPDASETMDRIGLHAEGTTTTWLAGAFDPRRPLDPRVGDMLQTLINAGYRDFIGKVAQSRGKTPEEIDEVAQGRVWSGRQALEFGLVDQIGGLQDAIAAAAGKAGLGDDAQVVYVEREPSGFERFLMSMGTRATAMIRKNLSEDWLPGWLHARTNEAFAQEAALLKGWEQRPTATYAYCFCDVR